MIVYSNQKIPPMMVVWMSLRCLVFKEINKQLYKNNNTHPTYRSPRRTSSVLRHTLTAHIVCCVTRTLHTVWVSNRTHTQTHTHILCNYMRCTSQTQSKTHTIHHTPRIHTSSIWYHSSHTTYRTPAPHIHIPHISHTINHLSIRSPLFIENPPLKPHI